MPINISKLVLHNLCVPFSKRICARELQSRVNSARQRGNTLGLWAAFHAQAQAQIAADNARIENAWSALGQ